MTGKIRIKATTYKRKGKRVQRKSYLTSDRGKRGRTPKSMRWYEPKVHTGWEKDMPAKERRQLVLDAHGGDLLAAARSKQALANVSTDPETRAKSLSDARYFFGEYRKFKGA